VKIRIFLLNLRKYRKNLDLCFEQKIFYVSPKFYFSKKAVFFMDNDGFLAVVDSVVDAVLQTDVGVAVQTLQETAVQIPDTNAVSQAAANVVNTVAANSAAIIDFARVSAPMGKDGLVNGWIVTSLGMLVVGTCLLIIVCVISLLPKALVLLDKYFPENSDAKKAGKKANSSSTPVEAVAAAVAVAYHNYNNNGK
jgi:Na+-transporting methylmalonyl-CoA/oxaloacetate decarboxylase gamma subunit